jgi:signal transduction histidine kinase
VATRSPVSRRLPPRPARPRGWSLTTRIVVVALTPALVAVVLAIAITVGLTRLSAENAANGELRQAVESFAQAAPLVARFNQFSPQERQQVLTAFRAVFRRVEDADFATVRNGVILVSPTSKDQFATSLDVASLLKGETVSGRARTSDGTEVLYAAHLIGARSAGQIVLVTRDRSTLGTLPRGWGRLIVAGLLAAAVAVFLSFVLGRRLGSPLRQLSSAAFAVARGQYGRQVRTTVGGEIGALAHDFNAMSNELESSRDREREFIMDVSHDLRTPLTSIRGYAEGIVDGTIPVGEAQKRAASVIVGEAARLERLVGDLLSLERLDAGQMSFSYEEVELRGFLQEVLDGRRPGFDQAGVRLTLFTPADVVLVTTDPDRLAQVVGNLLDNALRYSPSGSQVRVDLGSGTDGGAVIWVSDQGPGIAAEDMARVFERLYVSSKYPGERASGSGLGLAIVARIMAALGGRVDVRSERGTAFRLLVPPRPPQLPRGADRS